MSTLIGHAFVQSAIHHVCETLHIPRDVLLSRSRAKAVTWARQVAMTLSYEIGELSSTEVGRLFDRDHADVLYAVRQVHDCMDAYPHTDGVLVRELQAKVAHETFG